jgi:urease accessory protein
MQALARITTMNMIEAPMPNPTPLARLLWFASPTFPTGAYAYSHGLEYAVEAGEVTTEAQFQSWLETFLHHGAGRSDAILVRHAHRAAHDEAALKNLAELAAAMAPGLERQLETTAQGNAFATAASVWAPVIQAPYPVAFGAFAATQAVPEHETCTAYLAATIASLVSAGIRLIPLGQTAGLRLLRDLEAHIFTVVADTEAASLDDLGTACFRADIAAMRHETQHTRIFRS